MPTVTIDADKYERLRYVASEYNQWFVGRGSSGGSYVLQPGDLDPVEPDPEPSVEAMLDALIADDRPGYGREVEITENRMGGSVKVYRWFDDDDEGWKAVAGKHGIDWRDALRAVYQQKVNETCRQ